MIDGMKGLLEDKFEMGGEGKPQTDIEQNPGRLAQKARQREPPPVDTRRPGGQVDIGAERADQPAAEIDCRKRPAVQRLGRPAQHRAGGRAEGRARLVHEP